MITSGGSNPRDALIDLTAVGANARALLSSDPGFEADVAGDAYGHGAARVASAIAAAGVTRLLVRDQSELAVLLDAGMTATIADPRVLGSSDAAALYGLGPRAEGLGLRPAMRVSARVIAHKAIRAGEPVSYGYTWRAPVDGNLAMVPLGYADGLTRAAGNRGEVWVAGIQRRIVGRVAMDVVVLDTGEDDVEVGAEAVLFGDPVVGASADAWSRAIGIPVLEATSGLGARVKRTWR